MKFSSQLKLNCVPDWTDQYIAYSHLKKIIYSIEKTESKATYHSSHSPQDPQEHRIESGPDESTPLITTKSHDSFFHALDIELECIVHFYLRTEKAVFELVDKLQSDVYYCESTFLSRSNQPSLLNSPLQLNTNGSRVSSLRVISKRSSHADHNNSLNSPAHSRSTTPLIASPNLAPTTNPHLTVSLFSPDDARSATTSQPNSPPRSPLHVLHVPPISPFRLHDTSFTSESSASERPTTPLPGSSSHNPSSNLPATPTTGLLHAQQHVLNASAIQIWNSKLMKPDQTRLSRECINLYVSLHDLRDYTHLNHTGFAKILKKYNKVTGQRNYYLSKVDQAYPFTMDTRDRLDHVIALVEKLYAHLWGNSPACLTDLKANLRQHVAFERNTIWRDMVSRERQMHAIRPLPAMENQPSFVLQLTDQVKISVKRPSGSFVNTAIAVIIMGSILSTQIFDTHEQQACFAILITASWLWMTEAVPLFVTGLLIPLFVILLNVLRDPVTLVPLNPHLATKFIFGAMFSPVIMLLLGGFSIAAALSKHFIAKIFAVSLLTKAGNKTIWVLLANMMVATFASMWISNVAAPVLCFSIIQPILRTLPSTSTFGPALILGIALASNIGGMASPISSPQNVIALENMKVQPSWMDWFLISIPICIVTNIITWLILLLSYKPHINTPEVVPLRHTEERLTMKQWFILGITALTILLWCVESAIEQWVGDMGIIAIFPIVVFFGTGILTKDDWNNFLWTVIILAMGGIALGKAVDNSGLLEVIATTIKMFVQGMSVWSVLLTFTCLMLVVATFISHTVAALILLPIVAEVGNRMADPHPQLLVMGAALMCSGAMGLPISGFPNMNAISQEDATGKPYLRSWDFIRSGVPGSIGVLMAILTIGYGTMSYLDF